MTISTYLKSAQDYGAKEPGSRNEQLWNEIQQDAGKPSSPETISTDSGTVDRGRRDLAGLSPKSANARVLAKNFQDDLIRKERIDFRGKTARSPADIAHLAQVYRDPRYESFYYFFVKADNTVAGILPKMAELPESVKPHAGHPSMPVTRS